MVIKTAYYYFFYKLYKFAKWSPSIFPSDFIAAIVIIFLEVTALGTLKFYYEDFINFESPFELFSFQTIIPLIVVFVGNYMAFIYTDAWRRYVHDFDQWPPKKNLIGTFVVAGIILFILLNFMYSVYLMSVISGIE